MRLLDDVLDIEQGFSVDVVLCGVVAIVLNLVHPPYIERLRVMIELPRLVLGEQRSVHGG